MNHKGWPRGLAAVTVVGALGPALLGLAWVVSRSVDSPLRADESARPLVVPVGSASRDRAVSVVLTVERSEPFQVTGAGAGTVTNVHVAAGERVEAGDPVVDLDDQPRVAFTADAPLWRDLASGDRGEDVDRLREFLTDLGLPAGTVPGRVTPATVEGIRRLNESLGRGTGDLVLHRASLLWIGPAAIRVHEVLVHVGEAVGAGQALVSGPTRPTAVVVEAPEGQTWPDADHLLAVGDGLEVPFEPEVGRLEDPESVAAVTEALRADEGPGMVRLAAPEEVGTLPVAAVVTDADGRTCVFDSESGPPVPIEVSGGSLSIAEVPAEWVGRPVLVNPREVREDLSCG